MHVVVETSDFIADAKATGITDEERGEIVKRPANEPLAGDPIPGTGGARKLRFRGRGKGKSGGYRVITFYTGEDVPVSYSMCSRKATGSICRKPSET